MGQSSTLPTTSTPGVAEGKADGRIFAEGEGVTVFVFGNEFLYVGGEW
jgi:hypothetical protein